MHRRIRACLFIVPLFLLATAARAEEPLAVRYQFGGNADFFATGAAMAADGPDVDTTMVDMLLHPATTMVTANDVPVDANLRKAFLYWGGSIANDDCMGGTVDSNVVFTPPGQQGGEIVAEACYCSDAAAAGYDIQLCRADVTLLIDDLVGEYSVDGFDALIENGATNNASFSIVLVYSAGSLPTRNITVYDGLLTMWNQSNPDEIVSLDQIIIDDPPVGQLTWYALEGDINGGGAESVSVNGLPGNQSLDLFDFINPVANPMNHTINTTMPPQTEALGVDIDEFDISAALTAGDTQVDTTYYGGGDKYWIAYNIIGVNVFAPDFGQSSSKSWTLHMDADQSGDTSPGDTIRYSIELINSGDADGLVRLDDPMPAQVESWMLVEDGGGTDMSTADSLIVEDIAVAVGGSAQVVFDVVLAPDSGGSSMINVAAYEADGSAGQLEAPPVMIAGDPGDGDGDGDPGDGDGDGAGDGDGDGDSTGTSGGGTDEDTGEPATTGAAETTGFSGGGNPDEGGCNCTTNPEPGRRLPIGLGLLVVLGIIRRRR